MFFRIQVFQGPGFSGSGSRVRVQGPGFGSKVRVQGPGQGSSFRVRVQGPGPGSRVREQVLQVAHDIATTSYCISYMRVLDSESLLTFSKNVAGDLFANQKVAIYTFLKYLILILNDRHFR